MSVGDGLFLSGVVMAFVAMILGMSMLGAWDWERQLAFASIFAGVIAVICFLASIWLGVLM